MSEVGRLREAAKVLRERAEAAPPGPWGTQAGTSGLPADGPTTYTLTAPTGDIATGEYDRHDGCALDYAATMHPGVGLALADLLDGLADDEPWDFRHDEALAIANLVLGGAS